MDNKHPRIPFADLMKLTPTRNVTDTTFGLLQPSELSCA